MNCLVYWYQYGPKFYNWLPVFLEKVKTTGTSKNFIIHCQYFSLVVIFLFSCEILVIYLPITSHDGVIFLRFSLYGALGLLLCPESKKHKRSGSLPNDGELTATYRHIFAIIFGWRVHWRWYINERLMNSKSFLMQPVE